MANTVIDILLALEDNVHVSYFHSLLYSITQYIAQTPDMQHEPNNTAGKGKCLAAREPDMQQSTTSRLLLVGLLELFEMRLLVLRQFSYFVANDGQDERVVVVQEALALALIAAVHVTLPRQERLDIRP